MKYQLQKSVNTSSILSASIVGIFVYFVFSYLFIPAKITLPLSIFMSILSFGLTQYYSVSRKEIISTYEDGNSSSDHNNSPPNRISKIPFVIIYCVTVLICVLSEPNLDTVYISWNLIGITDIIKLGAGILLSFFLPGYAILLLLTKKYAVSPFLKILFAYIGSILITGLTTYISAIYLDNNISGIKIPLIVVNLAILAVFVVYYRIYRLTFRNEASSYTEVYRFISNTGNKVRTVLIINLPELIVFGSLFGLLIISTYYLYGGATVGDQWDHQGRAIIFLFGYFRESVTPTGGDILYTPLQSAFLAGLTALSSNPLVNTYASIAFLNMTAVFAFYYFCREWFPLKMKRAGLLACTFFVLSGGFGWIYILYSTGDNPVSSEILSITSFLQERIKFSDIILSANFMVAAYPDFSTGLIYIALPAGFLLLGLLRFEIKDKFTYTVIVSIVSLLGVLFHDEFYIFIIVSSILPLIFNMRNKNSVYLAFLIAFAFVYFIDRISPVHYFTARGVLGFPLINLDIFFVMITWAVYATQQKFRLHINFGSILSKIRNHLNPSSASIIIITKIILVWAVAYLTALSFVVWAQLPPNYIQAHTQGYNNPWYLYPLRLGLVGLFGLAYILSYLFKKFEKEVFVFGVIVVIALLTGPYYFEHRFSKYIMVGMIGFASLLIFRFLSLLANRYTISNGVAIALIVLSASLSTLMYIGYNALVLEAQDYAHALGRRNFPSLEEMNLLQFILHKIHVDSNTYNVASFPDEYDIRQGGIITKLRSFSGLPYARIAQSPLTLNASTLDTFYHLLENSNTKYIIIPHKSIKDKMISAPTRFAIDNFQPAYNDSQFLVLTVPSLSGPSTVSKNNVAVVSSDVKSLSPILIEGKGLHFKNDTYDLERDFYYPLSSLALSRSGYDVFLNDDYSVFSKKVIIIPSDPTNWGNSTFNKYVDFADAGGTLVVMNSDDFNGNGMFSKLFSIVVNGNTSSGSSQFTSIAEHKGQPEFLNVSGKVNSAELKTSADTNLVASYLDKDNRSIAPFIIEKNFPSKGKIILVNTKGYFDAIKNNPKEYFASLSNFSNIFGFSKEKPINQSIIEHTKSFVGEVKISGSTSLNGSSILLPDMSVNHPISVGNLSLLDKGGNLKNSLKKVSILSMKLSGDYQVFIDAKGKLMMPSPISQNSYIGILLPKGFNMTVKIPETNNSNAEIITMDGAHNKSLIAKDGSVIELYNVKSSVPSSRSLPVIMKNPEINVKGNLSFKDASFYGMRPNSYVPLKIDGTVKASFDFVDKYGDAQDNGTSTRYTTYLKSIDIDAVSHKDIELKLPGDIPSIAKNKGQDIPLKDILNSPANILILIILTTITVIISKLYWPKIKFSGA